MNNNDKLLKLKGKELSILLGTIFYPDGHDWDLKNVMGRKECSRCDAMTNPLYSPDTLTCVIPTNDSNVAMKWRDWAIKNYSQKTWHEALFEVYKSIPLYHSGIIYEVWLEVYIQPKHYLQAAALCKLKGLKDDYSR